MGLRRRFAVLLFVISFAGCGGSNQPSNADSSSSLPASRSLGDNIDVLAQTEMHQSRIPGMVVAIAKNRVMLYVRGYGISNLSTARPVAPTDVFEIGSLTKQFTAALIMKLQEQGRLNLDDSVATYLPDYGFPAAITIRMLLTHTSGLANFTDFPEFAQWMIQGVSQPVVLSEINHAALQFQPGTQYAYSNSNFYVLGSLVEKVTGQSFAANLEQYILGPLALQNTYYDLPPSSAAASGYGVGAGGPVPAIIWDRSAAFAAGAMSSNVYDLVAWDSALISGRVVSSASF